MTSVPEMVLAWPYIESVLFELEQANMREINSLLAAKDDNFTGFLRLKEEKRAIGRVRARLKALATPPSNPQPIYKGQMRMG